MLTSHKYLYIIVISFATAIVYATSIFATLAITNNTLSAKIIATITVVIMLWVSRLTGRKFFSDEWDTSIPEVFFTPKTKLAWSVLAIAVSAASVIIATCLATWVYQLYGSSNFDQLASALENIPTKQRVLMSVILAAITEECLMRGILLRNLLLILRWPYAIAVSSIVFAVAHGNIVQGTFAAIISIVLSMIFIFSGGKVIASIIAHGLMNAMALTIGPALMTDLISNPAIILGCGAVLIAGSAMLSEIPSQE